MVRAAAAQNSEHPPVSLALVAIPKARLKNCNLHQLAATVLKRLCAA